MTIWLPPQFSVQGNSSAGQILQQRLDAFKALHSDLQITVRIKALEGPAGMVESLAAASAAAPGALPDLIALPRSDLESAAVKGLLYPFDSLTGWLDNADWYDYARGVGLVQGKNFGIPFAGDALVLIYRPSTVLEGLASWQVIFEQGIPVAFPLANPQGLEVMTLYRAAGGEVVDSAGRPRLDSTPLAEVLTLLANGDARGAFPAWMYQIENGAQSWQAYREQRTAIALTWASHYLDELPADTAASPLPALGGQPLTLATGWSWAMANPDPQRRALAVELAEYLTDSAFLARWTSAAGYLPPRPTSLAAWENKSLQAVMSQVVLSAQVVPGSDLLISVGPLLRDAALQVTRDQIDPIVAAQLAVGHFPQP